MECRNEYCICEKKELEKCQFDEVLVKMKIRLCDECVEGIQNLKKEQAIFFVFFFYGWLKLCLDKFVHV